MGKAQDDRGLGRDIEGQPFVDHSSAILMVYVNVVTKKEDWQCGNHNSALTHIEACLHGRKQTLNHNKEITAQISINILVPWTSWY